MARRETHRHRVQSRDLVQSIADRYGKPNAKRALWIMDRLLLAIVSRTPPQPPASNIAPEGDATTALSTTRPSSSTTTRRQGAPTTSIDNHRLDWLAGLASVADLDLQDLPHLDFQALYQDMEMPFEDQGLEWNLTTGMNDIPPDMVPPFSW